MVKYVAEEKPKVINDLKDIFILALVYAITIVAFRLNAMEIVVWTICTLMILLLKSNVPVSIILTLFFLVPSDYSSFMQISTPIGGFPYYWVLILVFIIYYSIFSNIRNIRFSRNEVNIGILFTIFTALQLVSSLINNNDNITINLLQFLLQSVGMLLLIKIQQLYEEDICRLFYYIIFLVAIVDFAGFCEIFLGFDFYNVYHIEYYHDNYVWALSEGLYWRSYSTFGNPLVYSGTLMLCLAIVEYFRHNNKKVVLQILLLSLIIAGSLLSGSRSAIVISLLYVIYYIARSKFSKKVFLIILALCTVPVLFRLFNFDSIIRNFQTLGQSKSAAHRAESYKLFWDVFANYILLGSGLGNSYEVLKGYVGRASNFMTNTFDNAFMDFSLAVGIFGIIVFILIFVNVHKILKLKKDKIAFYAFIFFCMISFVMNATKYISLWGLLWTFVALNAFVNDRDNPEDVLDYN